MRFGAGKGLEKGMGITLGTGLGTSIYQNGEAQDMALGINYPMLEGCEGLYIHSLVCGYLSVKNPEFH
jgi:glucokinase